MSANTISNNKISNIVNSQVPFFVRNDHQSFVKFLEKYYQYLEQNDKVVNRIKNAQRYYDIDLTEDIFANEMYKTFLKYIPESSPVDKSLLLKHIKDFYRSKGSEKSVRFLMNILFKEIPTDIYYPKQDVLRASDGKWYVKTTLRVNDIFINSVANNNLDAALSFVGTKIKGNTSNAIAIVESVDRFFENNVLINELVLSNIDGNFENGEQIFAAFDGPISEEYVSANVFGGQLANVEIIRSGSLYEPGTIIPLENENTGSKGLLTITKVGTGVLDDIYVQAGGAGYRSNDNIIVTALDLTGSGATANVYEIQTLGTVHPNSYSIMYSTIDLVANDILDYSNVYSSLNNSNVNTTIANATSFWSYDNTGPILSALVLNSGSNYSIKPELSPVGNTQIISLGILGRLRIMNGGIGYEIGDEIEITNVLGGFGTGARANVIAVNSSGTIVTVGWKETPGEYTGGSGYDFYHLPKANVISQNVDAHGAEIVVVCTLGTGANLVATNTAIGAIEEVTIVSRGINYSSPPTLNLESLGDGTALVNVSVQSGVYSYPGRYLNDDGQISSYNFLQDRDYYQSFSYVIRSGQSIEKYRNSMNDLIHPIGMKLFGEYDSLDEQTDITETDFESVSFNSKVNKPYYKNANTITVGFLPDDLLVGNNVFLEFISGGLINVQNSYYTVNSINTISNSFDVLHDTGASINTISIVDSGWGYLVYKNTSNLTVSTYYFSNTSNVTLNTVTGISVVDSISVFTPVSNNIVLSQNVAFSNVLFEVNDILTINTGIESNTSNLTIDTGEGNSVTTINLNHWVANSNVYIDIGSRINVENQIVYVQSVPDYYSNVILVTPGLSGNLVSSVLNIIGDNVSANIISIYRFANTSKINVYPSIPGNLKSNVITITKRITALSENAKYSNVSIQQGDTLNVNNELVIVTYVNSNSNIIRVNPQLSLNLISNVITIRKENLPTSSYIMFNNNGRGSGANVMYSTNANGSIISLSVSNIGNGYIVPPIATANGINTIPAIFTVTLLDTTGNVDIYKIPI